MSLECIGAYGDTWKIYKDGDEEWHWNRKTPNGRIVGASTEGYVNKSDCEDNARRNGMDCKPK